MKGIAFRLASGFWSTGSETRRFLTDRGFFKPVKLDARVISVGNIQAGGAGKTPLVALIAQEAADRGFRVCILARGYRSRWERDGGILSPGDSSHTKDCGDEAALLHELCPKAYIGVGANRVEQYNQVLNRSQQGMDLVILDDGFQNYQFRKDLEIVAVTSAKPGQILFRDRPHSLRHADLVVWTKGKEKPEGVDQTPWVQIRYQLPKIEISEPLWLVSGVAENRGVFDLALKSGYPVQRHVRLKDHHTYDLKQVRGYFEQARKQGLRIAMTGKDWVKWKDLGVAENEVLVLEPQIEFVSGKEIWSRLLWQE